MLNSYKVTNLDDPNPLTFTIVSTIDPSKRYKVSAKTKGEAVEWMNALNKAIKISNEMKEKTATNVSASFLCWEFIVTLTILVQLIRRGTQAFRNSGPNGESEDEKIDLLKKGWLLKKGKRRFFVLNNDVLMWFVTDDSGNSVANMKGSMSLSGCSITSENFNFSIKTKRGQVYQLTATSQNEVNEWVEMITAASKDINDDEKSSIAGTLVPLKKSGWVVKKGKRRFLLLRTGDLLYFEREQNEEFFSEKPKGIIRLAGSTVNQVDDTSFLVRSAEDNSWIFVCDNASIAKDWIDHLTVFIVRANDALANVN